jgi:hypothetical protein
MIKLYLSLCVALLVTVGFYFFFFQEGAPGRRIASTVTDVSAEDAKKIKTEWLQKTFVVAGDDHIEIAVGAFENICSRYTQVEVVLRAEGVSVEGESPTIRIRRPCQHSLGSETLSPINIFIGDLLARPADDQTFQDNDGQTFEIKNAAGVWPPEWHVAMIRLTHEATGAVLDADSYEIAFVKGGPLALFFKTPQ